MMFMGGQWNLGVWSFRTKTGIILVKAPWNAPLFSERCGYVSTILKCFGWRLLWRKFDRRRPEGVRSENG